jgi:glycerol-3-phosphate dehydrogenase
LVRANDYFYTVGNLAIRKRDITKAGETVFDLCIIGGGATGAGCALDAAARGYKVLLIEKKDFGAATSGKSTKLIHGGVRYLEQAVKKLSLEQFRMVRKALKERKTLLKIAPHITRPLQLITPCRTWIEGVYYYIGLKLYDWISGRTNIGGSELLGKKKALERIPTLKKDHLFSAVLYYDGQLDDLRYNLALIQTAQTYGAVCFNHMQALRFEKNEKGKLNSVWLKDALSGNEWKATATVFINATGPFADAIRQMANQALRPRIRVSRGVHILLPKHVMNSHSALLIPQTRDGRVLFAIPYQKHLLVGTTDDETSLTENEFGPTSAEVYYLLEYINEYLDVHAQPSQVLAGFGGLRPLVMAESGNTKDLVRDHEVETDGASGLISILGGKWTTYRLMAKDTIDTAEKTLGKQAPCTTDQIILVGSKTFDHTTAIQLQKVSGWDHEVVKHLVSKYGDQSLLIAEKLNANSALKDRLLPGMPYTLAELDYVLENEMAYTIKDVLARRWGVQLADWKQTRELIPVVGGLMAEKFGWRLVEKDKYIVDYTTEIMQMEENIGKREAKSQEVRI